MFDTSDLNQTLQKGFIMLADALETGFSGIAATMTENNNVQNQKLDNIRHELKRIAEKVNQ